MTQKLFEGVVDFWVDLAQVIQFQRVACQLFEEYHGEVQFEKLAVINRQPDHNPDELILLLLIQGRRPKPVQSSDVVVLKHPIIRVEDVAEEELEKLFRNSTLVDPLFADELHLQRLFQRPGGQSTFDLLESVVHKIRRPSHSEHEIGTGGVQENRSQQSVLKLVTHGAVVFELQDATLGRRVVHKRLIAERKRLARVLPSLVVFDNVEVVAINGVVVENGIWSRIARLVSLKEHFQEASCALNLVVNCLDFI
mmetsp:Transcript_19695/g.35160  ORF Transcript_19695/g.35160 Transcript_19695/m.35160 type:complete len:253 (-) Transcript_19695:328-1086(-)